MTIQMYYLFFLRPHQNETVKEFKRKEYSHKKKMGNYTTVSKCFPLFLFSILKDCGKVCTTQIYYFIHI